jgi:hypothetical protein
MLRSLNRGQMLSQHGLKSHETMETVNFVGSIELWLSASLTFRRRYQSQCTLGLYGLDNQSMSRTSAKNQFLCFSFPSSDVGFGK